ncbi:hypothetical protein N781_05010 [Pontibacillus halophilus JSM 076056 = DSM 19796]|uniref:Fe/B12 periplasmic-binding domain-containing protein n=1 Tax=Pontibacillus halophilus JSM 076056 = DSM 19796 TaxID=1385510 RepID=A0A0A5GD67_9BACI|nr:ABC transporter substrate-binding protein [Pontibacillus halophilus]KGX91161.1 hypothetical protein N781_05010 [Pontibacillus halophilus JSM 076056 = DSM 19796]
MKRKQRSLWFALMAMLLLVLAACGGNDESNEENEGEEAASETTTYEAENGEVEIPANAENIAVLQPYLMDHLLTLGITPHAGPIMSGEEFPAFMKEDLQDTTSLGNTVEPSMETILNANPDLIIGVDKFHSKVEQQLSGMAPTVILKNGFDEDWQTSFQRTAEVVGEEERAEEVLVEFDEKAAEAKQTLDEAIGDETVMVLRVREKELRYYGMRNYSMLYNDLGLARPAEMPGDEEAYTEIALEKLPEINPDHIFMLVQSDKKLEELKNSSIWSELTAVQKDQIYNVDFDIWHMGHGPKASDMVVDKVVESL